MFRASDAALGVWNRAIALSRPTVRSLLELVPSRGSVQVFSPDPSLHWLATNLFFEIGLTSRLTDAAEVVNLLMVMSQEYFRVPLNPGAFVTNLHGLKWGQLAIPCVAQEWADYVNGLGAGTVSFIAESDANGTTTALVGRVSGLTFEFRPQTAVSNPKEAALAAISYAFRIPYEFTLPPILTTMSRTQLKLG